jgi:hypothetical protein
MNEHQPTNAELKQQIEIVVAAFQDYKATTDARLFALESSLRDAERQNETLESQIAHQRNQISG